MLSHSLRAQCFLLLLRCVCEGRLDHHGREGAARQLASGSESRADIEGEEGPKRKAGAILPPGRAHGGQLGKATVNSEWDRRAWRAGEGCQDGGVKITF